MNFAIFTRVAHVAERFKTIHVSGVGKDAIMKEISLGWYIRFEGSQEAVFVGRDRPQVESGDHYKITFERLPDALPR